MVRRSLVKLLSIPELSVGLLLTDGQTFSLNASLFRDVLNALSREHGSVKATADGLLHTIEKAKNLAAERNRYVHALAVIDVSDHSITLFTKERVDDLPLDEGRIEALALECSSLATKIYSEQNGLWTELKKARAKRPTTIHST